MLFFSTLYVIFCLLCHLSLATRRDYIVSTNLFFFFSFLSVQAYGKPSPLGAVAQASLKGPQQLVYKPFDPSLSKAIDYALRQSGMSLNPQIEDGVVNVRVLILIHHHEKLILLYC